jgi:hypothetical protein
MILLNYERIFEMSWCSPLNPKKRGFLSSSGLNNSSFRYRWRWLLSYNWSLLQRFDMLWMLHKIDNEQHHLFGQFGYLVQLSKICCCLAINLYCLPFTNFCQILLMKFLFLMLPNAHDNKVRQFGHLTYWIDLELQRGGNPSNTFKKRFLMWVEVFIFFCRSAFWEDYLYGLILLNES